jgi:uncharacterized protein (DUF4415 family)
MMMNAKSIDESWKDPDDAPKLTDRWVQEADAYHGKTLVRRGRPKLEQPKRHVSLRLDYDVIESFKASGPGWQGRINEALRRAARI